MRYWSEIKCDIKYEMIMFSLLVSMISLQVHSDRYFQVFIQINLHNNIMEMQQILSVILRVIQNVFYL